MYASWLHVTSWLHVSQSFRYDLLEFTNALVAVLLSKYQVIPKQCQVIPKYIKSDSSIGVESVMVGKSAFSWGDQPLSSEKHLVKRSRGKVLQFCCRAAVRPCGRAAVWQPQLVCHTGGATCGRHLWLLCCRAAGLQGLCLEFTCILVSLPGMYASWLHVT